MYNVGPNYSRTADGKPIRCDDCGYSILPIWDGCEGEWKCPECYNPLPNYEES